MVPKTTHSISLKAFRRASSHLACISLLMLAGLAHSEGPVLPIVTPPQGLAAPDGFENVQERLYASIDRQAHNLLSKVHAWGEDEGLRLLTESKSGEHWIRPNTGAVLGFAFLHRFGPYDAAVVGVSKEALLEGTIIPMMRYLTTTHLTGGRPTGDGKPWGSQWQSAHWAHMVGRGAWWIWDDLPPDLEDAVRRVIAHEADRIAATDPPHQVLIDTKAEENAWNSQVLSVARALMPEDARWPVWEQAFQRWALSAFLRPADRDSDRLVDGRPLSEQFIGANIHDDFTLENHRRVHPDYMTTFILSMGCALDFAMGDRRPPDAVFHNCAGVYENLKWFSLPSGGFVYPNGQDWELLRDPEWVYLHLIMASLTGDPDAWHLMLPCLATQEKMQARSASGAVYLDEEYFFASTLSDQLYYCVMAWLAAQYRGPIEDRFTERRGVRRFDSGKFILNRTPSAIHAVSWGANVMAQVVAFRLDRVTSPHPRSGIGHIRVEGQDDPLAVKVRNIDVKSDSGQFAVSFELHHGARRVGAFLDIRSMPDGTLRLKEKLVALREVKTLEVATGLIGVLNNPNWVYERGERRIALGDSKHVIRSGDGTACHALGVRRIDIDGAIRVQSRKPLNVLYRGAEKAERARFTDELYLNYCGEAKTWQAGDVISQYDVAIACPR